MRKLIERFKRCGAEGPTDVAATPQPQETATPAPKPPPELPLFFMVFHLEEDGPVRLDGVKLGVCEVMGLELDEPKLGGLRRGAQCPRLPGPASYTPAPAVPGRAEEQAHRGPTAEPATADEGGC